MLGMTGEEVISTIRQQTDTVLLAFSCGKDALVAWLAIRPHFSRIVPYYMYLVPGLEFVEDSLAYYEREFGQHIIRVPHPSLYRMLNAMVFQPPERQQIIRELRLPDFSFLDMQNEIRKDHGLSPKCYTASGVRSADSQMRMLSIKKYGAISHAKRQFFPVHDWKKERMVREIEASGIRLAVDYQMFGRSFDGVDYRFLEPMKRHAPSDYARVLKWFPMAELEIKRREYAAA
jgi:hypothetical protein